MSRRGTALALTIAAGIAFWLIWSKLRIVVWVHASLWQVLLLFAVLFVAIFLGLDHVLNRSKR